MILGLVNLVQTADYATNLSPCLKPLALCVSNRVCFVVLIVEASALNHNVIT